MSCQPRHKKCWYIALRTTVPQPAALPLQRPHTSAVCRRQDQFVAWDYNTTIGSRVTTLFEHWYVGLTTLAAAETNYTYWDNSAFLRTAMLNDAKGQTDPACTASHK